MQWLTMGDSIGMTEQESELSTLGRRVRVNVTWSVSSATAARMLNVGLTVVIVRLVSPHEYGVFAIGLLMLAILTSMNELGISVAVLRSPTDPVDLVPTATTLALAGSVALYVLIVLTASHLAALLGAPSATAVIRIVALNVILDGVSSIPNALMSRSFQQGRRAAVDMVAFFVGAGVTVGLVEAGFGAMGLAWGSVAGNAAAVVTLLVLVPGRSWPGWDRVHARTLLRGGIPFAATSAVYLATLNVDYVVVARTLGTAALGLYVLAFNLSSWPATLVSLSIRRVAQPAFSRLVADPAALRAAFFRALHLLAAVAVLIAVLLATLAHPLIEVAYGSRWLPAAPVLVSLSVLGAARVVLDLKYDVLVAMGKGRTLLIAQMVWLVSLICVLPVAARVGGIEGVGVGHVVVLGIVGPVYLLATRRSGFPARSTLVSLALPVLAGAATAMLLEAASQLHPGPWTELLLYAPLAGLVYLGSVGLDRTNRDFLQARLRSWKARNRAEVAVVEPVEPL